MTQPEDFKDQSLGLMPLAARMRPQTVEEFYGQSHLLSKGKPLYEALKVGHLHSMVLWGPPGSGKTTLAKLLAGSSHAHIEFLSAVLAGVKDIRRVVDEAICRRDTENIATILFVDEVHRFNKSQQDAFLPYVENGILTFIGATTENPSFSLNNALLSRCRVYVLNRLMEDELVVILKQALTDSKRGYGKNAYTATEGFLSILANYANGDARNALNLLEIAVSVLESKPGTMVLDETLAQGILGEKINYFDKQGEYFYDLISALHKAVRGTDPDAALYWFCRMLEAGCDPLYLARRIIRMASEDIGNADPRALALAIDAMQAYDCLGSPEGELALAQAVLYCAVAPKSNAAYVAFGQAMTDAKTKGNLEVPLYLRNAPTKLMKQLGYAKAYRYPHDYPEAYVPDEMYFPPELSGAKYYYPVPRGLEQKIKDKLEQLTKIK